VLRSRSCLRHLIDTNELIRFSNFNRRANQENAVLSVDIVERENAFARMTNGRGGNPSWICVLLIELTLKHLCGASLQVFLLFVLKLCCE
jgi:hypothetical protein